jgi:multidrug resistance protein
VTQPLNSKDQFKRLSVLIATNCVDMIGFMIVVPLLPFYALDMAATPIIIGWIIASHAIAQLVAAPIWGRLSDRFGRRPVILISLTASAGGFLVFGLANTVFLLFLSRIIQGMGGGTTGVAQAYVADTIPPAQRARALGWLSAATSAGVVLGPALGSLAAHWGQAAPGFIAAGLSLLNVFFAWRWLPETRSIDERSASRGEASPVWHTVWEVLRHPLRPVASLIWVYAAGMLAFAAMTSVVSLYLEAEFAITAKTIGYFFVYIGGMSFIMRSVLLGPLIDRIGEYSAMSLGTVSLAIGLALYPLVPNLWTLVAVMPLVPIGTALLFPSTTSLMSQHSARGDVGAVMGTAQTYAGISRVIAPLAATAAFQRLGHGTPFWLAAGLVVLVGLRIVRLRPRATAAAAGTSAQPTGVS